MTVLRYSLVLLCLLGTAAAAVGPVSDACKAVPSYSRYVYVQNVPQLEAAVTGAKKGDLIEMRPRNYVTALTIQKSGGAKRPIVLCGPPAATISGNFGAPVVSVIKSKYITLSGFSINNGLIGILVDSSSNIILKSLAINRTVDEGIRVQSSSTAVTIKGTSILRTGRSGRPSGLGQGIIIGSTASNDKTTNTKIIENNIVGRIVFAQMILVYPNSDGGVISNNLFGGWNMYEPAKIYSWVKLNAGGYKVTNNTGFSTTRDGFISAGSNNVFEFNKIYMSSKATGVGINVNCSSACQSTNTVACTNTITPKTFKLTNLNIAC